MRNLITVAFVEPVAEGLEFPRDDWPLHLTLVKFDLGVEPHAGTPVRDAKTSRSIGFRRSELAERIATLIDGPEWPLPWAAGSAWADEAGVRARKGSIPVNLIDPSEQLQVLHNEGLVRIVEQLPGPVSTPRLHPEGVPAARLASRRQTAPTGRRPRA